MDNDKVTFQTRKKAFAIAVVAAITVVQTATGDGHVINEGGSDAAVKKAKGLLNGSSRRFFELFRMTPTEFEALVKWLHENCGLTDSRRPSPYVRSPR